MAKFLRAAALTYLIALIFFCWGWLAVAMGIWPYRAIEPFYGQISDFFTQSHKETVADMLKMDHQEQAIQFDVRGLEIRDPGFAEDGYLLISRYSKTDAQAVVELLALDSGQVLHTWRPDLTEIFRLAPEFSTEINTRMAYRSQHPYLLENGDLLITSGEGPLVRIDSCGKPVWLANRHFHHSIERRADGNFVVPLVLGEGPNELGIPMREEGIAVVTPEGEVTETYSLHQMLLQAGYQGLLYGVGEFEEDRLHLNDIQPLADAPDEFLISLRNISSIARINVATGQVLWLKTGPWVNQHDVEELTDGWISLFGNDLVRSTGKFLSDGYSQVYLYNPASQEIKTPYTRVLQSLGMHTKFEGRVRILPNGDAFIEETNRDRLMRISATGVRWEYVNAITDETSGALHWSRYLEASELPDNLLENL